MVKTLGSSEFVEFEPPPPLPVLLLELLLPVDVAGLLSLLLFLETTTPTVTPIAMSARRPTREPIIFGEIRK